MFCKKCGKEIKDGELFCPSCGHKVGEDVKEVSSNNGSKFGWGLLGFFIPLAGLILFIVWFNDAENKLKGKAAGIGALISTCSSLLISVIWYVIRIIIIIGAAANRPEFSSLLSLFII